MDAERRCRLVEDQHLGTKIDRPGDRDALPLATGQRSDRLFGIAQSLPENIAPFVFSAGIILVSLSLAFVMRQRGSATRRSDNWSGNSTE